MLPPIQAGRHPMVRGVIAAVVGLVVFAVVTGTLAFVLERHGEVWLTAASAAGTFGLLAVTLFYVLFTRDLVKAQQDELMLRHQEPMYAAAMEASRVLHGSGTLALSQAFDVLPLPTDQQDHEEWESYVDAALGVSKALNAVNNDLWACLARLPEALREPVADAAGRVSWLGAGVTLIRSAAFHAAWEDPHGPPTWAQVRAQYEQLSSPRDEEEDDDTWPTWEDLSGRQALMSADKDISLAMATVDDYLVDVTDGLAARPRARR